MLYVWGDGARALQQYDVESAQPVFDVASGQILSSQLDQLLLLPLMNGMNRSAERIISTRFHLDKNQYPPVFSHKVQFP
jgi:hypothetical protein